MRIEQQARVSLQRCQPRAVCRQLRIECCAACIQQFGNSEFAESIATGNDFSIAATLIGNLRQMFVSLPLAAGDAATGE
jgi:hypothetical protein